MKHLKQLKELLGEFVGNMSEIEVLFTEDDLPEKFDLKQKAAKAKSDFEEAFRAKNPKGKTAEEVKEIEAAAKSAVWNTAKQQLKSTLGFDIEGDIKKIPFKEVLSTAKEHIGQAQSGGDEKLKEQLGKMTERYNDVASKLEEKDVKINELEDNFEKFKVDFKEKSSARDHIKSTLGAITFIGDTENQSYLRKSYERDIEHDYLVKSDGSIFNKDGSAIVKDGDKGTFKNVTELVNHFVDNRKHRAISNGGNATGSGAASGSGTPDKVIVNGKEVDYSAANAYAKKHGLKE